MLRRNTKSLAALLAGVFGMPAMPTAAYAADELGSYGIDTNAISVSGISSGGYMAQQFHVAHSKEIMGTGIIAGGPYDCADNKPGWPAVFTAMAVCSHTLGPYTPFMGPPSVKTSVSATKTAAENGSIDPTQGLAGDKVYLFSGTKDKHSSPIRHGPTKGILRIFHKVSEYYIRQ